MQVEENKTKGEQNFHLAINSERTIETETRPPAWRLTDNPLAEREASGVVRVTEMLRQLNSEARRGSESEEERTSRRSSAGDSGLGNLSESEVLDQDSSERERPGRAQGKREYEGNVRY